MDTNHNRVRKWLMTGALTAGVALGAAGLAGAATGSSTSTASSATGSAAATNTAPDPAAVAHGPGETLLTGTTAAKVKSAALAAVPGATVLRVETDAQGSPYEAHLRKSDGTQVTVKVDASFKVTATQSGFGGGPGGGRPATAGSISTSGATA